MSAPPHPSAPPSYNESMQEAASGFATAGAYQPNYGSVKPPPAGQVYPPQSPPGYTPPAGGVDPNKPGGGYYPPQAGYPPGQPGYPPGQPGYPPPAGSVPSQYQHTHNVVVQSPAQSVVVVGGCPACRVGILEDDFTCCGVLCAILFFPIGILCCLALRQRRCANCGAIFG